jgi:hypothetical protein
MATRSPRNPAEVQAILLQEHLSRLYEAKADATKLVARLLRELKASEKSPSLARELEDYAFDNKDTLDAVVYVLQGLKGIASLARQASKSAKLVGKDLVEANKKMVKEIAKTKGDQARYLTSKVYKPDNIWVDFLLNFDSPSFWLKLRRKVHDAQSLLQEMRKQTIVETLKGLKQWNTFIRIAENNLKACRQDIDVSTIA